MAREGFAYLPLHTAKQEPLLFHACFADWRMAPREGFEPSAYRLTAGCSTAELPRNGAAFCKQW